MSKGTTIKEALSKWEEKNSCKAAESGELKLYFQMPPVEKMDASLSTLACCTRLSLSSNSIEKIANLNGLKNLKILSLGRNCIKTLTGLEAVGDTLEQLWISYNYIEKLKGIAVLKKLQVLYISNNQIKDIVEVAKLKELHHLHEVVLTGNPVEDNLMNDGKNYRAVVIEKVPQLKKLDGVPVISNEEDDEQQEEN